MSDSKPTNLAKIKGFFYLFFIESLPKMNFSRD
jgi:hypothetical protein